MVSNFLWGVGTNWYFDRVDGNDDNDRDVVVSSRGIGS